MYKTSLRKNYCLSILCDKSLQIWRDSLKICCMLFLINRLFIGWFFSLQAWLFVFEIHTFPLQASFLLQLFLFVLSVKMAIENMNNIRLSMIIFPHISSPFINVEKSDNRFLINLWYHHLFICQHRNIETY